MTRLEPLADPVRLSIARHLVASPEASAPEVADAVGVHLNTARTHLAALTEAGVAERSAERGGGRGRPVVRYRLRRDWSPSGDEWLPLATLLASAVNRLQGEGEELIELGRDWGRRWAGDRRPRPVEASLTAALEQLGFRATVTRNRLELSRCPCPVVAPDGPASLCALADGVVDGVLEGSGIRAGRPAHDPKARRCGARLLAA